MSTASVINSTLIATSPLTTFQRGVVKVRVPSRTLNPGAYTEAVFKAAIQIFPKQRIASSKEEGLRKAQRMQTKRKSRPFKLKETGLHF